MSTPPRLRADKLTRAVILKLKPNGERQEIPIVGATALYLIMQPSGTLSWAMRFREGKLTLGPFDPSEHEAEAPPAVGGPLTADAALALAAEINRQRARGVDVIAVQRAERQRAIVNPTQGAFPIHVRDFIDGHAKPETRRWRETAHTFGLDYPSKGDGEPTIIKGGLVERWRDRQLAEITEDDIYALVDEAQTRGIPGLKRRGKAPSNARGRRMAVTLGKLFDWLKQKRRIRTDPSRDVHRPRLAKKGTRILNTKVDVRGGDELRFFWRACDQLGLYGALLKMLLLTGARREEIARMEFDELNADNSMLRLPGGRTKNHREHNIPLPPLARSILAGVPRISSKYVFSTDGVSPYQGHSKAKKKLDALMLAEARKERGPQATIPKWKAHDLRRSCSSGMAAIGIAPHVVEACINHVSGSKGGVAGVYNQEQYLPERVAAYARWAAHVEALVSGRAGDNVVSLRA